MTPETKAILDAATPNSHSELENSINSLSETAFRCLGRYQKRHEADQLLIAEMVKYARHDNRICSHHHECTCGECPCGFEAALTHAREQKPELFK